MVYLFGVIDNMRCVSHFPYLGPNYSTKKKKKSCTKISASNEKNREGEIQRHAYVLVRWKNWTFKVKVPAAADRTDFYSFNFN